MKPHAETRLPITGLGVVGALGLRAGQVLAAQRCNMVRTSPSTELRVADEDTMMEKPLPVHAARGLTAGYEHQGRWLRLTCAAIDDMLDEHGPLGSGATGLVVVTPTVDPERHDADPSPIGLADLLRAHGASRGTPFDCRVISGGEAVFSDALAVVAENLGGAWQRAILVGVDSLVDHGSLRWLHRTDKLRNDENPVGIVPGEAAACILFETPEPGRTPERPELARITSWRREDCRAEESAPEAWGARIGAAVNAALLDQLGLPIPRLHLVTNHTGDSVQARVHGSLLSALDRRLGSPTVHVPCVSFGSIGTASGCVGLTVAVHIVAHRRHGQTAVVVATNGVDEAGVVVLQRL